jgi:hypothetical protein
LSGSRSRFWPPAISTAVSAEAKFDEFPARRTTQLRVENV